MADADAIRTGAGTALPPGPFSPPDPGAGDAPAEPAVVEAEGLGRRFGDLVAVEGIDLRVPAGSILGIVGPSGSGKTTTIRMITGSLRPSSGAVRVLGESPDAFRRATRERMGVMPQKFTLYPDLTTRENVDFVASLFGMLFFRRRRRTREVLELLDLWPARRRRAKDLSGGMQRRLELAATLVHEPDVLVLDEPTAGIDPILRQRIWAELHRLRDLGRTLLVTTQYVTEAEECDAVALISEGRLIALDTPDGMRRSALGGESVAIETAGLFDVSTLRATPAIRKVRQVGAREFVAIVDDAGSAAPEIVEAVAAAGGEVASVRELRPTFEEVFAELVRRHAGDAAPEPSAGAPQATPPPRREDAA